MALPACFMFEITFQLTGEVLSEHEEWFFRIQLVPCAVVISTN